MIRTFFSVVLLLFAAIVNARPVNDLTRTLVVVDESISQSDYTSLFRSLQQRNHHLDIKHVKDQGLELLKYDLKEYDNLVILPMTKTRALGSKLTAHQLLDFFDRGGNIFAITNPSSSPDSIRDFAAELDIHISPRGYKLVDHFIGKDNGHDKFSFSGSEYFKAPNVITQQQSVKFSAANAAYLGNNEYTIPILNAAETSYVYDSRDEEDVMKEAWVSGTQAHVSAAFQSKHNARFFWVGSADLVLDNAEFSKDVTEWTFQEKAVIKSVFVKHKLVDSIVENEKLYKVSEDLTYSIGISEWNGESWGPFSGHDDVQLEFVMLDPYYRITLDENKAASGIDFAVYSTNFKIPDQYGMFTFKTQYERPGLSFIDEQEVVTIRHIANDEWPRSWKITNSWVYLTSVSTVISAWLLFVVFYLYSAKNSKVVAPGKKNN